MACWCWGLAEVCNTRPLNISISVPSTRSHFHHLLSLDALGIGLVCDRSSFPSSSCREVEDLRQCKCHDLCYSQISFILQLGRAICLLVQCRSPSITGGHSLHFTFSRSLVDRKSSIPPQFSPPPLLLLFCLSTSPTPRKLCCASLCVVAAKQTR